MDLQISQPATLIMVFMLLYLSAQTPWPVSILKQMGQMIVELETREIFLLLFSLLFRISILNTNC